METIFITVLTTFASGILSSLITLKFSLNKELISIKRERLEQYVQAISDSDSIYLDLTDHYLFDSDRVVSDAPLAKLETLTILYFTKIQTEFSSFNMAIANARIYLLQCRQQRLTGASIVNGQVKLTLPTTQMISGLALFHQAIIDTKSRLLEELKNSYPLLENETLGQIIASRLPMCLKKIFL